MSRCVHWRLPMSLRLHGDGPRNASRLLNESARKDSIASWTASNMFLTASTTSTRSGFSMILMQDRLSASDFAQSYPFLLSMFCFLSVTLSHRAGNIRWICIWRTQENGRSGRLNPLIIITWRACLWLPSVQQQSVIFLLRNYFRCCFLYLEATSS